MIPERLADFWFWINERQRLRDIKFAGNKNWWKASIDETFRKYGYLFYNVKREDDDGNTYLREEVTAPHELEDNGLTVFNVALFQAFGTINFMKGIGGWQTKFEPERWEAIVNDLIRHNIPAYTSGYNTAVNFNDPRITEESSGAFKIFIKLEGIWNRRDEIVKVAEESQRLSKTFQEISTIKGYGGDGFMAYELAIGLRHTKILENAVDKLTWANPGPGTRHTLNYLYGRDPRVGVRADLLVEELKILLDLSSASLQPHVPALEMRNIEDCCCEYSRYSGYRRRYTEASEEGGKEVEPMKERPLDEQVKELLQFADAIIKQPVPEKRPVGRPRIHPIPDPLAVKRPVGRPKGSTKDKLKEDKMIQEILTFE